MTWISKEEFENRVNLFKEIEDEAYSRLEEFKKLMGFNNNSIAYRDDIEWDFESKVIIFKGRYGHCNNCAENYYVNMPFEFLYDETYADRIKAEKAEKIAKEKEQKQLEEKKAVKEKEERDLKLYLRLKEKFEKYNIIEPNRDI